MWGVWTSEVRLSVRQCTLVNAAKVRKEIRMRTTFRSWPP